MLYIHITFILSCLLPIQNNNVIPVTSSYYIRHPVTTLLTTDMNPLCTRNPDTKWWSAFPFP